LDNAFDAAVSVCVFALEQEMTQFTIEFDQETDGRWIAEIPALPGVLCYGESKEDAVRKVEALALRILADRIEQGDEVPELDGAFISTSA
jgi:predicted RNase H-like HicB family nuclease